ncbi:protein of unknown function [Agromyces flavus]|nr:protein of unknown function [Agromyces flavus]
MGGAGEGDLIDEAFVGDGWLEEAFARPSAGAQTPSVDRTATEDVALAEELARVVSLERTMRWAQAEQFRLVESARVRHARLEGVGEVSTAAQREFATRSFVAELATTLVVPEATAGRLVADATRLAGPRAATLAALAAGELSGAHVRSLLEVTSTLPGEAADEVERVALMDAGSRTSAAFRRRLHRLRERLHPESLSDRHARAALNRRVALDPAPDGMAWLSLFLQADRAVAIMARLDALADAGDPKRPDPRTTAQRAADVAADLLLSGTLDHPDRLLAAATGRVAGKIVVTVPVLTLLGVSDEPAELDGYGPIDADTARRLAGHAPSLHRLLVHPESGAALSYGRTTYRAGADLAGYVRVRDGGCRFPGCARRATTTDLDHTAAWAHGGRTDADNLAHLCRAHHRLKHHTGWRMVHEPGGTIRWTSPAGHHLTTHPERPFTPVGRPGTPLPAPPAPPPTETDLHEPVEDNDPPWLHARAASLAA